MARQLFISEKYVKDNSVINENVDVKLIRPTIWDAQEQHIEEILGTDLYDDLLAKIESDTLNADETTLVNKYIAEALRLWVVFEFVLIGEYKMRNKAVVKQNSENSQPLDYTENRYYRDYWRKKAEFKTERLVAYLCDNTDLFPKYLTNSDASDLHPRDNGWSPSLYLGIGHEKKCEVENKS